MRAAEALARAGSPFKAAMRAKTPREKSRALGVTIAPARSKPAADQAVQAAAVSSVPAALDSSGPQTQQRPSWNASGNPKSVSKRDQPRQPSREKRPRSPPPSIVLAAAAAAAAAAEATVTSPTKARRPTSPRPQSSQEQPAKRVVTPKVSTLRPGTKRSEPTAGTFAWENFLRAAKRDGFSERDVCRLSWGGVRGLVDNYGIGASPIEVAQIQVEWRKRRAVLLGESMDAVLGQQQQLQPAGKKHVSFAVSAAKRSAEGVLEYFFADMNDPPSHVSSMLPRGKNAPRVQ